MTTKTETTTTKRKVCVCIKHQSAGFYSQNHDVSVKPEQVRLRRTATRRRRATSRWRENACCVTSCSASTESATPLRESPLPCDVTANVSVMSCFREALPALAFFQSRQTRPAAWKCQLEIGTKLKIACEGFIRVRSCIKQCCITGNPMFHDLVRLQMKEAKPKSFKQVYAKDVHAEIERVRTYHLNDDDRTEIEKDDVVEG